MVARPHIPTLEGSGEDKDGGSGGNGAGSDGGGCSQSRFTDDGDDGTFLKMG